MSTVRAGNKLRKAELCLVGRKPRRSPNGERPGDVQQRNLNLPSRGCCRGGNSGSLKGLIDEASHVIFRNQPPSPPPSSPFSVLYLVYLLYEYPGPNCELGRLSSSLHQRVPILRASSAQERLGPCWDSAVWRTKGASIWNDWTDLWDKNHGWWGAGKWVWAG